MPNLLPESAQAALAAILPADEILDPSSPRYADESRTWAAQKQRHPAVVVRPGSAATLQRLVPFLYGSGLDFAIRCGGIGSSSATDVVVSMRAFDGFVYDASDHTVVVGAGQTWGEIDRKLEEVAPDRIVVSARTPWVGVAGSTLSGGLSWVGTEFGLSADPQNMLDVQVVLRDGRQIWASSEPGLLWALRGGGGNFGVVTAFRFRTYPFSTSIFAGHIAFPSTALEAVSRGVAAHAARPVDPLLSFHCLVAVTDEKHAGQSAWTETESRIEPPTDAFQVSVALFVFDARGEAHGRSEAGFKWALDIPGAVDTTTVTNLRGVNELQGGKTHLIGATNSYLSACLTSGPIDPAFVVRGKAWVDAIARLDPRLGPGTLFLLEVMPGRTLHATAAAADFATAWPHRDPAASPSHVLQLLTGSHPDASAPEELALHALALAPYAIKKTHAKGDFFPNFLEHSITDRAAIFGANYPRLQQIKKHYDPQDRFNKGSWIPLPEGR